MATTTHKRTAERRDHIFRLMCKQPRRESSVYKLADLTGWPEERVRSILRAGVGIAFVDTRRQTDGKFVWRARDDYEPRSLVADPNRARSGVIRGRQSWFDFESELAAMHRLPTVETGEFLVTVTNCHGYKITERCYTRTYEKFLRDRLEIDG